MQIGELNHNLSRQLRRIESGGEPVVVDYYGRPRTVLLPPDLYNDLVAAAGERGQEVLERHRTASEQQKQEAAA